MKLGWACLVLVASVLCFLAAGIVIGTGITGRAIVIGEDSGIKHLWEIVLFFAGVTGLSIACYVRETGKNRKQ